MRGITIENIRNMVNELEQQRKSIPEGKILVSGNKELIDHIKEEGWQGEFVYSQYIDSNTAYIAEKGYTFKPYPHLLEGVK